MLYYTYVIWQEGSIMEKIRGNTFGVKIDIEKGTVHIGEQLIIDNEKDARLFYRAYAMGRDHKKQEIRMSLGV